MGNNKCKICGSAAINHHLHGRDGSDPDLCDVCFWRNRAWNLPEHYQIFDILERLWVAGFETIHQDRRWHLFAPDGEGIISGKTFRELCVNIVLEGIDA